MFSKTSFGFGEWFVALVLGFGFLASAGFV